MRAEVVQRNGAGVSEGAAGRNNKWHLVLTRDKKTPVEVRYSRTFLVQPDRAVWAAAVMLGRVLCHATPHVVARVSSHDKNSSTTNSSCLRTSCKEEVRSHLPIWEKRHNPSSVCTNGPFGDSKITRASGSRCETTLAVALGLIKSQALWSSATDSFSQAGSPAGGSDISLNCLKANPTQTANCAAVAPEKP